MMLEIRKTAGSLEERDILELERIVTDSDEKEALRFLKKSIPFSSLSLASKLDRL